MTDAKDNAPSTPPVGKEARRPRRLPGWKKVLLAGSVALMAAGLGLQGFAYLRRPAEQEAKPTGGRLTQVQPKGFLPTPTPGSDAPKAPAPPSAEQSIEDWYPAIFRLGFSFFVGFCIAYALRAFFKVSLAAIGVILLALFGLQYAGVVQVDWSAMGRHYDGVVGWLAGQFSGFKNFVTGYLPSAASAGVGLFAGFRRG